MDTRTLPLVGALLLFAAPTCRSAEDGPTPTVPALARPAPSGLPAPAAAPAAAPEPLPEVPDPPLLTAARAVTAGCEVNVAGGFYTACGADELGALERAAGAVTRLELVETLLPALASADPSLTAVAAAVLARHGARDLAPAAAADVDAALVARALSTLAALRGYQAAQAAPALTHLAVLGGELDPLLEALARHPHEAAAHAAYRHLLTYGRRPAFDALRGLAERGGQRVLLAALAAPLQLPDPTGAERAAICPWAAEHLGDLTMDVMAAAGRVMRWCGGGWLDKLLDEGERRRRNRDFGRPVSALFGDVCGPGVSAERCDRALALLTAVADDDAMHPRIRAEVLTHMAAQWPDDKRARRTLARYARHRDAVIRSAAQAALAERAGERGGRR